MTEDSWRQLLHFQSFFNFHSTNMKHSIPDLVYLKSKLKLLSTTVFMLSSESIITNKNFWQNQCWPWQKQNLNWNTLGIIHLACTQNITHTWHYFFADTHTNAYYKARNADFLEHSVEVLNGRNLIKVRRNVL